MASGTDLSPVLDDLLRQRGWTQEQLAKASGISRNDINAMARGRLTVGPKRLGRIAAALKVSVLELGAPEGEADARGQTLLDRQQELEASVLKLTKQVNRLARQVAELKRQAPPGAQRGAVQ